MVTKKFHPAKHERQWARTAQNKIKVIEKALLTADEKQKTLLLQRLEFWKSSKRQRKTK